jgi:hypothetical protein
MFANQLEYHLIQVRPMITTIALSDMNNAFRHVLLVAIVNTINMKATGVYMSDFAGESQARDRLTRQLAV